MERNSAFEEMLDEIHEPVKMGELTFYMSTILRECDPVAYSCYLSEWEDANEDEENEDV